MGLELCIKRNRVFSVLCFLLYKRKRRGRREGWKEGEEGKEKEGKGRDWKEKREGRKNQKENQEVVFLS